MKFIKLDNKGTTYYLNTDDISHLEEAKGSTTATMKTGEKLVFAMTAQQLFTNTTLWNLTPTK